MNSQHHYELEQPLTRSMDNNAHAVTKLTHQKNRRVDNTEQELMKVLQEPLHTYHNQPHNSFTGGSLSAIGSKHMRAITQGALSMDKVSN